MATPTALPATFVAGNVLTAAQQNGLRGAFRVLQVVQATTATEVNTTSTSYVTTGLSASITPSATSSKILIVATIGARNSGTGSVGFFTAFRGTVAGTNLAVGTGTSFSNLYSGAGELWASQSVVFLDSPSTVSATTYTIGMKLAAATSTLSAQRNGADSTIILMEISA